MAANRLNDDAQDSANGAGNDNHEAVDFFETEISRYAASLEADPEDAYQRYGFTLYHSLPPAHMVVESRKLGFFRDDAVDSYNLAGLEIGSENYEAAAALLEKALKMDDTLADATYNLALCYEKLGRKAEAIKLWNRFKELADEDEDLQSVEAHLAEIQ